MHDAHVHDLWAGPKKHGSAVPPGARWQVRWHETDPTTGRVSRPGRKFRTQSEAKTFAASITKKLSEGVAAPSTDGTALFRDVAAAWQRSRHDVKRSHRDRAERELRTWVLPRFGATEVRYITRLQVQHLADCLLDGTAVANYKDGARPATAPLAASSVRSIVGQVRQVLQYAVDNNLMTGTNPVQRINVGKILRTKMNFLDFDQVDRLRNLVADRPQGHQHAVLVEVMAYCGLRIGEALLLRADDVNFTTRRIRVERSWTTEGTRWVAGTTKTSKTRYVPFGGLLEAGLRPLIADASAQGFLFPGPRGTNAWQPDNWRSRVWTEAIRGTEFTVMKLTPHDLRHTAASMAIAAGAEVLVVQTMLGHSSATETLNTYSHLWPDRLDSITAAVDAARLRRFGRAA